MRSTQLVFTFDPRHAQGLAREETFFDAAELINADGVYRQRRPSWLRRIDRATTEEDMEGIDAFARTDKGDICIQIKSSFLGALHHQRKYPEFEGLRIVIPQDASALDVATTLYKELPELYEWMFSS